MSWISVDKELPEKSAYIIAYSKGGYMETCYYSGRARGAAYEFDGDTHSVDDVTHWQPLPAPPLDWDTEDSGAYTNGKYWVYEMNGQWMLDERDLMAPDGFISLSEHDTEDAAKEAAERLEGAQ